MIKKSHIVNFFIIILSLIFLEFSSSIIIYSVEKKVGLLFSPFSYTKTSQIEYKTRWDKKTDKIVPGKYLQKNKNRIIEYKINSKGFRGKEFTENKNSLNRIISLGGSTTMGLGSEYDMTYPAQLESMLKNEKIDVEVLNFGLSSKSLSFIRKLLFSEAINYDPDLIIIYSNRNPALYDSQGTKINIEKDNQNIFIKKVNLFLIDNIMTFRLIFKTYRKIISMSISSDKIISPHNVNVEHNIYYFTDQYKDTLEEIILFCKQKNIKVALVKQAVLFDEKIQKKIELETSKNLIETLKNLRNEPLYDFNYAESFWIITNAILNKDLDLLSHHENTIIIDPVHELIKNKDNFSDYIHLTDKGNTVLAESIFLRIKDVLRK